MTEFNFIMHNETHRRDIDEKFERILERVSEMAPSDSTIEGELIPSKDGYLASITIYSGTGECICQERSQDPFKAMRRVNSKIQSWLSSWRHDRIFDSSTSSLMVNGQVH